MHSIKEPAASQVIARAASILKALEKETDGISVSELSRITGLPRTTVHRLVTSLEAEHLLINADGSVRLGPALARLAAAAHTDVAGITRSAIEKLGRRTRETVEISVYRGVHAISVSQYVSDQELRVVSAVGTAFPCHCTAHGKALLANLEDAVIRELYVRPPERRTTCTIGSVSEILHAVSEVRTRGYAIDREEHARGVCGIGISLKPGMSETYAISVAVPALRFDESFESILSSLLQCKVEIETLLTA